MEKSQIVTYIHKPLNITTYDVKWIPYSARVVVLGCLPKGTGTLRIYELEGADIHLQREITKPTAFKCGTFGASSIPDRNLATGNFEGKLEIWDLEKPEVPVYSTMAHSQIINNIDGVGGFGKGYGAPEIATCGRDGAVKVWDPRQKDAPVASMVPAEGTERRDCWTVTFGNSYSNTDRFVCSGYDNGDLKLFDLRAMKIAWETNLRSGICCVEFNRKDIKMDKLVATTLDSKYNLIDVSSKQGNKGYKYFEQTAHKGTIWTVRHVPNFRDIFMTTGGSGSVALWKYCSSDSSSNDFGKVNLLREATISTQPISSFDWSPDKQGLGVCTSFDQSLRVLVVTKLHIL